MALWPLTTEIIATFLLSAGLLYRYGNWTTQNVITTISVFVAWFFSFIVIFILPLDISTTSYLQCQQNLNETHATHNISQLLASMPSDNQSIPSTTPATTTHESVSTTISPVLPGNGSQCEEPWSYVPNNALPALWRVVYWVGQVMTWVLLPIMQSYAMAGDFTPLKKLRTAFIENLILYGIFAVTFILLLIYVVIHNYFSWEYVKVICITASNTFGLLLLVILLGYGLVEIPRKVYESSRHNRTLQYLYFKVAKLSAEKCESEEKLDDALEQIQHTYEAVVTTHQHLRPQMDVILDKCPFEWRDKLIARYANAPDRSRGNRVVAYNESDLVRLHGTILRATQAHHRTWVQWNHLITEVIDWEDVAKNSANPSKSFKRTLGPDLSLRENIIDRIIGQIYTPKVEWYWKCRFRSPVLKVLGVVLAIITFLVIWSEMTFSIIRPNLSIFSLLFEVTLKSESYFLTEVVCVLSLSYLTICAYYTVFKIRIFNYYYLASHHQTDEYSLIFCGMILCRLTPPLCLNFLSLMHLDSHVTKVSNRVDTAFTSIMGHMDVIPFISQGFNVYLPIVMCLFCLATFLEVGSRFLHYMGIEQFILEDDMTADFIKDGQELVKREKNKRLKSLDGGRSRMNPNYSGTTRTTIPTGVAGDIEAQPSARPALTRGDSGENARLELLGDADPVDYSTTGRLEQSLRHSSRPQTNIFDDV